MLDEKNLQTLLRLKRHEMPPPGYHERVLQEFHRRQQAELLRRPLWQIALDRAQNFFGEHRPMQYAYAAGAAVAVALAAAVSIQSFQPVNSRSMAEIAASETVAAQAPEEAFRAPAGRFADAPPRYVLDSRPVSYEPPYSF